MSKKPVGHFDHIAPVHYSAKPEGCCMKCLWGIGEHHHNQCKNHPSESLKRIDEIIAEVETDVDNNVPDGTVIYKYNGREVGRIVNIGPTEKQDRCLCGGIGCNSCEPQGR